MEIPSYLDRGPTREEGMAEPLARRYTELADWFHLLTAPEEYAEEAALYLRVIREALGGPPRTLLELGSGGGNNASHYKHHVTSTLVDLSPAMLAVSQRLNPECEHLQGDMRTVRLGRAFDVVFIHDAVMYLTTEVDLRQAIETAYVHCRPGGVALFVPDCVRETFVPRTEEGGHDGDGRAMRFLEWSWDPDPSDTTCLVEFAYLLHEDGQPPRCEYERQNFGLFGRADWLRLFAEVGFQATARPHEPEMDEEDIGEIFVAMRPEA
jgi:SAM-dependent methyltransferase